MKIFKSIILKLLYPFFWFNNIYIKYFFSLFYYRYNYLLVKYRYSKIIGNKIVILLHDDAIGPFCHFTEYYLRYCKNYNYNLESDVIFIGTNNSINHFLIKLLKRKFINILLDTNIHQIIYNGGYKYYQNNNLYVNDFVPDNIKNGSIYSPHYDSFFLLENNDLDYGKSLLDRIGFDCTIPFICIHNKDQEYWSILNNSSKPWDSYRDSSFEDLYRGVIKFKNEKKINLIRCGHYNSNELSDVYNIMEFNKSEKEFLDFYLQSECKFSVVGDSGIALIPYLFKKPILYHNFIPMDESPVAERGIIIPKLYINSITNKKLTIKEILEIKLTFKYYERGRIINLTKSADGFQNIAFYNKKNITIIDNTVDEIFNGLKEIELYSENNLILSEDQIKKQIMFKNLFPINHPMRHTPCLISPYFLEMHSDILE